MSEVAVAKGPALFASTRLHKFVSDVFTRAGMTAEHAGYVADALVWANLRGMDSHGAMRIPRYIDLIDAGDINPRANIRVITETPASIVLDCDRASGAVAMREAVARSTALARQVGIGSVFVRKTTHTAAVGHFTQQVANQGMAAIAFGGSWPNMAYHGSRIAALSTSPFSIAVPGGSGGPIILDIATGAISVGKLRQAKRTGQAIPEGVALDKDGNPTTDPQAALIPLPLGGPKGSGLSLMIELIASVLVGNPILADALEGLPEGKRHRQNAFLLAIDVARYMDLEQFRAEVERLVRAIKALPKDATTAEILMPGERGARMLSERTRDGVPIPPAVVKELAAVAARFGIDPLVPL